MSSPARLQTQRLAAGLTQAELARRAGVSRALVSAVEAGRHLPRVDAALALAAALGTTASALFGPASTEPVDALSGEAAPAGAPVRVGFVGSRPVTAPVVHGESGWSPVDGLAGALAPDPRAQASPGVVLAGCEPGLAVLERLLESRGTHAIALSTSSAVALAALAAGRVHGAVTHFEAGSAGRAHPVRSAEGPAVVRYALCCWRVGLAAPRGARRGWWHAPLAGRGEVVQREEGASAQAAFERACGRRRGPIAGPRVASHLAASRLAVASGRPAVTIEPAAAAVGAAFHPLETHAVELWLRAEHLAEIGVARLLEALHSAAFRRTLESVGGYDLSLLGRRVA